MQSANEEHPERIATEAVAALLQSTGQLPGKPKGHRMVVISCHDEAEGVEWLPLTNGMSDRDIFRLLHQAAEDVVTLVLD